MATRLSPEEVSSSRRSINRSTESDPDNTTLSIETTLSERIKRAQVLSVHLELQAKVEDEEKNVPQDSKTILQRTLSVRPQVSTPSSFAERMAAASALSMPFRCIGRGSCGSVFEWPGTPYALKTSSSKQRNLFRDFNLTNTVQDSFAAVRRILESHPDFLECMVPRVPMCESFYAPEDSWWQEHGHRFPKIKKHSCVFKVDRILPLTQTTREALIRHFFPSDPKIQEAALKNPDNKSCLVRLYFGQTRPAALQRKLRNFPLYIDMAEELELDTTQMIKEMAIGLAILHWESNCDGADSEWVLGSAVEKSSYGIIVKDFEQTKIRSLIPRWNFFKRQTSMWLLDFDKAGTFKLHDADVIDRLVVAITGNDPYYPNPRFSEAPVFRQFKDAYLTASEVILERKFSRADHEMVFRMPQSFIDAWEGWADEDRRCSKPEIVFERDEGHIEEGGWTSGDVDEEQTLLESYMEVSEDESEDEDESTSSSK